MKHLEKQETATERRRRAREERAPRPPLRSPATEAEVDPFAEFHDGWEPVRKRRDAPSLD